MSKNVTKLTFPRVLCTSIKHRVPSWFDRFTAFYYCMSKNVTKFISPRVLCTSVTNHILSWFDRFTPYYNCMRKNIKKLMSPRVLFTNVTNRVCNWVDHFTVLLTTVWAKMSQNSYHHEFGAQLSQIVFLADLTVLQLVGTVWAKKFTILISPPVHCTSMTNRVLS